MHLEIAAVRTPVEDIGNINQLLSLQQIFIVKITQLISHDVQAKRKGVVYDILLALILEVELCVHDTYSSKSPENSTIDPVVSMLLGFGFLLFCLCILSLSDSYAIGKRIYIFYCCIRWNIGWCSSLVLLRHAGTPHTIACT